MKWCADCGSEHNCGKAMPLTNKATGKFACWNKKAAWQVRLEALMRKMRKYLKDDKWVLELSEHEVRTALRGLKEGGFKARELPR